MSELPYPFNGVMDLGEARATIPEDPDVRRRRLMLADRCIQAAVELIQMARALDPEHPALADPSHPCSLQPHGNE